MRTSIFSWGTIMYTYTIFLTHISISICFFFQKFHKLLYFRGIIRTSLLSQVTITYIHTILFHAYFLIYGIFFRIRANFSIFACTSPLIQHPRIYVLSRGTIASTHTIFFTPTSASIRPFFRNCTNFSVFHVYQPIDLVSGPPTYFFSKTF